MKAIRLALGSLLFVTLLSSISTAQVQRTFVSGLGDDSNPCSRTSPCRTISHALMGTNAGGEVIVLDSAGYGAVSITQSVSIIAPPGVYAGISVFSGNGVTINAGAADTVILRGLTINNQGSAGSGIICNTGGTLHIEDCVVSGFNLGGFGVAFGSGGIIEVKDSIMRGNGAGIVVGGSGGVDNVRLERNGDGLDVERGSRVTVRNSVASGNISGGFVAEVFFGPEPAELNIENCVASNNLVGISADRGSNDGPVTVRVSNSTVTDNKFGLATNGGATAVILSRTNNTVEGNGTDTSGTIGSYTAK